MRFDAPLPRAAWEPTRVPAARAWFADEVAVDFPAVPPLVERMRWAFFAGGDPGEDPLDAVLRLTHSQATRGGPVHAEVPLRRTCCACGGRGETWGERCAVCAGQGEAVTRRTMEILVPAGVPDGARLLLRLRVPGSPGPDAAVRLLVSVR